MSTTQPAAEAVNQQLFIQDGSIVIFDQNGGEHEAIIKIKANGKVRVGKSHIPMSQFIGMPYGAVFVLSPDGNSVERVDECPVGEWAAGQVTATERNNASLFDRNEDNQKLTAEEINAMKAAGKDGKEIINALCSNSATFLNKTEFAQEKYKRKKARKYMLTLTVRRPTARLLCQVRYNKGPENVNYLRPDSLAIMLSLANSTAGAKVLVIDGCVGLVIAGVMERLAGYGCVVAAQVDGQRAPALDGAKSLGLTAAQLTSLHSVSLSTLLQLQQQVKAEQQHEGGNAAALQSSVTAPGESIGDAVHPAMEVDPPSIHSGNQAIMATPEVEVADATVGMMSPVMPLPETDASKASGANGSQEQPTQEGGEPAGQGTGRQQAARRSNQAEARVQALAAVLRDGGFTSCVLAAPKLETTALMELVLPLLAPSAALVAYSPTPQPLAECLAHLSATRQAVLLQLQESWMRPYQVLPARTHPHMTCSGTAGFILSGYKVEVPAAKPTQATGAAQGSKDAAAAGRGSGHGRGRERGGRGFKRGRR